MVHSPDRVLKGGLLITDFPVDRAAAPACLTVPSSKLYRIGARWYHRRWDEIEPFRAPVPVISVGNITAGGSGKTPTVIALAQLIAKLQPDFKEPDRVAILSRGYGRQSKKLIVVRTDSNWEEAGDEPLLIKRAVPEAAVVVHRDRVKGARFAVEKLGARVLLMDDGFQHRRLARDLNVVLVDGERPLGNGYLLPAGPLREPPENLARATLVVGIGTSHTVAAELSSRMDIPFAAATPQVRLPSALADGSIRRVAALASIARPGRFIDSLTMHGISIVFRQLFADHHWYKLPELELVAQKAHSAGAQAVVTTEKDLTRIPSWHYPVPLLTVGVDMVLANETQWGDILNTVLTQT